MHRGVLLLVSLLIAPQASAADERQLRVGFLTDAQESGERPQLRSAIRALAERGADLLLYGGDTSYGYEDAPPDWRAALGPFENRTLFVYGNHDGGEGYGGFHPNETSATWWSASRGSVVFVGLDTNARLEDGSPQLRWLRETLAGHKDDVVVVAMHIAWWIPNAHHDARYAVKGDARELDALMRASGVDLVLAGHEHYYARQARNGITYVVGGAVEAQRRSVPAEVEASAARAASAHTWMLLDFERCGIVGRTYEVEGAQLDAFRVPQPCAPSLRAEPHLLHVPAREAGGASEKPAAPEAPAPETVGAAMGAGDVPLAALAVLALCALALTGASRRAAQRAGSRPRRRLQR